MVDVPVEIDHMKSERKAAQEGTGQLFGTATYPQRYSLALVPDCQILTGVNDYEHMCMNYDVILVTTHRKYEI
jgi:hypothetical protein